MNILFNIAKGIGAPLKIDNATLEGNFGHFARLLVDVDLSKDLPESLMIEREGHKFFIHIDYENLPAFCKNCLAVGHALANCRRNPIVRRPDVPSKNQKEVNDKAQQKKLVYKEKQTSASEMTSSVPLEKDQPVLPTPMRSDTSLVIHDNPIAEFNSGKTTTMEMTNVSDLETNNFQQTQVDLHKTNDLAENSSTQHMPQNNDKADSLAIPVSSSMNNDTGLNLCVDISGNFAKDSVISNIKSNSTVINDMHLVTSNSWADLADEEETASKIPKRVAKKSMKNIPAGRPRRGHASNPSL